jgi:peptidoglycan/xylan/chitin deacetylase (PgdA/CDA1 family)
MPAGKRLLVALAVGAGLALLLGAAWLTWAGQPVAGLALGLTTAVAAVAALQALWVPFDLTGRSLRRGGGGARRVALTFDDGPSDDTPAVLAALERAGVRATFFVLGEAALRRPELVREIARRGHEVALHGHTHAKLLAAGPARVARELDRCAAAIRAAGVVPAPLFRAPHGFRGPFLGPALRARGLTLVGWTRGVFDTARPGAAVIAARACRRMRSGEILLLHDGCATPGIDPRRDQTAAALPDIVGQWRAAGYELVTVSELAAGGEPVTLRNAGGGRS